MSFSYLNTCLFGVRSRSIPSRLRYITEVGALTLGLGIRGTQVSSLVGVHSSSRMR